MPAGDLPAQEGGGAGASASLGAEPAGDRTDEAPGRNGAIDTVSFADSFDAELAGELGDLGPADERRGSGESAGSGSRGGRNGGRRRHR